MKMNPFNRHLVALLTVDEVEARVSEESRTATPSWNVVTVQRMVRLHDDALTIGGVASAIPSKVRRESVVIHSTVSALSGWLFIFRVPVKYLKVRKKMCVM